MNRDVDDSGFCDIIGVFGAEPRRHAFSYDVSVRIRNKIFHEFHDLKLFFSKKFNKLRDNFYFVAFIMMAAVERVH